MRGVTTAAGLFLVVSWAACDNAREDDTLHQKCVVDGPIDPSTGSANRLVLPVPGKDVCHALREHCGGGRHGALCVKAALETILPDDRHVEAIRCRFDHARLSGAALSTVSFVDSSLEGASFSQV